MTVYSWRQHCVHGEPQAGQYDLLQDNTQIGSTTSRAMASFLTAALNQLTPLQRYAALCEAQGVPQMEAAE